MIGPKTQAIVSALMFCAVLAAVAGALYISKADDRIADCGSPATRDAGEAPTATAVDLELAPSPMPEEETDSYSGVRTGSAGS